MKARVVILTAVFACFTRGAAAQSTDQTGGVTGVVTDAVTHVPVRKATISLNGAGNTGADRGVHAASTDASGTFSITNLKVGSYRLVVQHPNYPQARFGSILKNIEVKAGETAGPVTVELMPGAAVSGHVEDEDGDPIQGCFIQPHAAKNLQQGVPMAGNSTTNEDGEYRIYGMPPGKYILTAQCQGRVFQPRPFSSGPEPPPTLAYPMQYYPLARDVKSAQALELTPGAEKSGVDFRMKPAGVTQVRGTFSGVDGHGNNGMMMQLVTLDSSLEGRMGMGASVNQEKGTFEFQQVFPGTYLLVSFLNGDDESRAGATRQIDVSDRPVDIALELRRGTDLNGKVEIETGGNNSPDAKVSLNQIFIQLMPRYQVGMPGSGTQVSDDGSFILKGVLPGSWRLQANGPHLFVKSAWLGATDVTNAPMDVSGGSAGGALRIVSSTNTATIRGSAPAGEVVFAQRVDGEPVPGSSIGSGVDQTGQYALAGLAPGKYRLTIADPGNPIPDEGGQEVTVHEGDTVMVDLKAPSGQ